MPMWGEELLECRLALFPLMPSAVVKEAFLVFEGVARAVFGRKETELHKRDMKIAAGKVDLAMMRRISTEESSTISTDAVGDVLFHIVPLPGTGFEIFTVVFASDHACNLVAKALPEQEERALAGFVGAAFANEELGKILGEMQRGSGLNKLHTTQLIGQALTN